MKKFTVLTIVLLAFTASCKSMPQRPVQSSGPVIPDRYIITLDFTGTSIHFKWKPARDADTPALQIEYRLYYSTNGNLTNLAGIDESGVAYGGWTTNLREITVSNLLPGSVYYYNVVARNRTGGRNLYLMKCQAALPGAVYEPQVSVSARPSALDKDWWKTAVFYECFVRMFKDSNGDGKGDFNGLISKLDYLKSLGIGGIWLLPIMESSDNDHGYCVIDYRKVETDYGTMDDFKRLIAEAHKRKIGIIIDLVVNHMSSQHPFFQDACKGWTSDYRNWFIWEPVYPGKWSAEEADQDCWHKTDNGYFFSEFWTANADLNYRNPSVRNYMLDTVRYWLNTGIDGFRLDAVGQLVENGPNAMYNQPETLAFFKSLRKVTDLYPNIFTVCETGDKAFLGNGTNMLNSGFAFGFNNMVMQKVNYYAANDLAQAVKSWICSVPAGSLYSVFLANHDTFAGQRVYEQFRGSIPKCKVASAVLLTLPGIPFLYYGEEIGMTSVNQYHGDLNLRTPMQWDTGANAGFTTGSPFRKPNTNYTAFNVATEQADPASLLNHYKKLIAIRGASKAINQGKYVAFDNSAYPSLYVALRAYENEYVLVVVNFSTQDQEPSIKIAGTPLAGKPFGTVKDLYDTSYVCPAWDQTAAGYKITIPAYGIRILKFS